MLFEHIGWIIINIILLYLYYLLLTQHKYKNKFGGFTAAEAAALRCGGLNIGDVCDVTPASFGSMLRQQQDILSTFLKFDDQGEVRLVQRSTCETKK